MESSDIKAKFNCGVQESWSLRSIVPEMVRRVKLFNNGRTSRAAQRQNWLIHRPTVVSEVLILPVKEQTGKGKKRKTIDVFGRLLTRGDLHQITAASSKRRSVDFVDLIVCECVV